MFRQTISYIDLSRLRHNVAQVRTIIGDIPQMVMIKADGYGHGIIKIAQAATEAGAQWLGVALAEEGALLRENGIRTPILIVGPLCSPEEVIKYNLRQTICSAKDVQVLEEEALRQGKFALVHIKVDTGMNRVGIKGEDELIRTFEALIKSPTVIAEGIFTHFSSADTNEEITHMQAYAYEKACQMAECYGMKLLKHVANSAATITFPKYRYDLVRLGIIVYGYPPVELKKYTFKPVLSFKSQVTFIKEIEAGEAVSYNRKYIADKRIKIATIAAGYGDGYMRVLSNKSHVLIGGKRVKILGNICMDQMMADITDIPDVKIGDEVVLIGEQGKEQIWADELAEIANTISYEIMLSITGRVPKVYINE